MADFNKIPFIHQNILHAPRELRGNIDLRSFDPPVATDKTLAWTGWLHFHPCHDSDDRNDDRNTHPR